jgi:glycosyltransferase involved in cell wall biosynthesis
MTVHNYRLICPNGLFYNKTGICERCTGGKEWNCVRLNCEESLPKSCGYALRNACARVFGFYINNVNSFLCLTDFQKRKLIENGFSQDKCKILPNFPENETNNHKSDISFPDKKSFLFIGRLNRQKGIDIIIKAAKQSPEVTFILAGSVDPLFIDITKLPSNVRWHGVIGEEEKRILLQNANALLFASRSYEGFPMVFLEAMENGLPVIAPYLAGYPEIIRKEQNGWLFKPEDSYDLSKMIKKVSENPELSLAYGQKGKNILNNEYNSDVWYREYMLIAKSLIVSNKSINV